MSKITHCIYRSSTESSRKDFFRTKIPRFDQQSEAGSDSRTERGSSEDMVPKSPHEMEKEKHQTIRERQE